MPELYQTARFLNMLQSAFVFCGRQRGDDSAVPKDQHTGVGQVPKQLEQFAVSDGGHGGHVQIVDANAFTLAHEGKLFDSGSELINVQILARQALKVKVVARAAQ